MVTHQGQTYERDLAKCRRLVLERQVEGEFDTLEGLAQRVGLGRTTVGAWLRGAVPGTTTTTARILEGLRVEFEDVHRKVETDAREEA
jgi:transcriptional regulator with XRE-family HTH domain